MYIAAIGTMALAREKRGLDARALGVLWFGACAFFGPVGCSSTQPGTGPAKGGETAAAVGNAGASGNAAAGGTAGEAGTGGAGEAGEAGAVNGSDAPWNEHSQHFELNDCFGFFAGTMAFSADRAQLNAEQRQALAGLQRAPSNDDCLSDPIDCKVVIASDRGEVSEYLADDGDAFCDRPGQKLSWSSLSPVLAALGCQFSHQDDAGPLSASPGCLHGLAPSSNVLQRQLSLLEAKRKYHVAVTGCVSGSVTLELFGADPSVPLATSVPVDNPGSFGTCAALDVELPAPITADLAITLGAGFEYLDFYLKFF